MEDIPIGLMDFIVDIAAVTIALLTIAAINLLWGWSADWGATVTYLVGYAIGWRNAAQGVAKWRGALERGR